MHVTVKWFEGKYPSFNVGIASAEGKEEFLSIKGCRIVNGQNGEFISWPATKNEQSGKYWNHVWASDAFGSHVLKLAKESQPQHSQPPRQPARNDFASDVPF